MKRAIRLATLTIAMSEKPVCDGTLLVIEEVNASGESPSRRIQPVVVMGKKRFGTHYSSAGETGGPILALRLDLVRSPESFP